MPPLTDLLFCAAFPLAQMLATASPSALTGELGTLHRPDGGYSSELSITVTDPRINSGQPTNIPTLVLGQIDVDALLSGEPVTGEQQERAIRRAVERVKTGAALPYYDSIDSAVQAAQSRSDAKSPNWTASLFCALAACSVPLALVALGYLFRVDRR